MYADFYNLKEKPFNLSPSPRYLYLGDIHKEALALLKYGVVEKKGFILLTGEVGTGKTTMVHALLESLDSSDQYVYLSNPLFTPEDFRDYLAFSVFKQKANFKSKAEFLILFEGYLKEQIQHRKNILLIIDEAQKLSIDLLEEIRLLSNMETSDGKLINIFLVGQPELNETLSRPECRPLLQRISIRYHIKPLSSNETREYIKRRMLSAGSEKWESILPKNTIKAIYRFSDGYPRMINILADNALMLGYSRGKKKISPDMIKECYDDLQLEGSFFQVKAEKKDDSTMNIAELKPTARRWPWLAFAVIVLIAALGVFAYYFKDQTLSRVIKPVFSAIGLRDYLTDDLPAAQKRNIINDLPEPDTRNASAEKSDIVQESIGRQMDSNTKMSVATKTNDTPTEIAKSGSILEEAGSTSNFKESPVRKTIIADAGQTPSEKATGVHVNDIKMSAATKTNDTPTEIAKSGSILEEAGSTSDFKESPVRKTIIAGTGQTPSEKTTGVYVNNIKMPAAPEANDTLTDMTASGSTSEEADSTRDFKDPSIRKTIVVGEGQTLNELATEVYGYANENILKYIQQYNPDIENTDHIEIGQKIRFPELNERSYQEAYTVYIASFTPIEKARELFNELVGKGYEAYIIPVVNTKRGKMFRITVGYFNSRQKAAIYASEMLKRGVTDNAEPITFEVK